MVATEFKSEITTATPQPHWRRRRLRLPLLLDGVGVRCGGEAEQVQVEVDRCVLLLVDPPAAAAAVRAGAWLLASRLSVAACCVFSGLWRAC